MGAPDRLTPQNVLSIDRWFGHLPFPRGWVMAALLIVLLLIPALLAYMDGVPNSWVDYRAQFIYAFLIVYMLAAIPLVQKTEESVAQSLRPLLRLDDAGFRNLVARTCRVSPAAELFWFCVGLAVGVIANLFFEPLVPNPKRLDIYAYASRIVLFGLVGWTFFVLIATTRLANVLLSQALDVDILDIQPFEPIGRQSLWLALTLIGGALLSLLSVSYLNRSLWLEYIIVYTVIVAAAVLVFVLNMRSAHRLLLITKQRELEAVNRSLTRTYRHFQTQGGAGQDRLALATQINALAAIKQELKSARTWPYNTEILRTLTLSILSPIFVALARVLETYLRSFM